MVKEIEKQLKKEGIEPPKDPKQKKQKKGNESKKGSKAEKKKNKAEKKAQKAQRRYIKESEQYNKAVENELRRMRRQQAATSTVVVGAVTAGAIVDANNNGGTTAVIRDTVVIENVKTDTVYIRDTIRIPVNDTVSKTNLQPTAPVIAPSTTQIPELRTARIFFASGSAAIGKSYTTILNNAAAWMLKNPDKKVLLSGVTDATGSPQLNRRLAQQRIDAVKKAFELRGIDVKRFEEEIQVSDIKTNTPSSSMRRVDMKAIQ
jgi:outer membrane protein OmpA-like peptidoglycan-associated protein